MKKKFFKIIIFTLLIVNILTFNSCSRNQDVVNCFPQTPINVTLSLNLPAYVSLNQVGGWMYINEQQSGTRGLIIIKTGQNTFNIYDRNAPHICPESNTTLEVIDNIKIKCPKDQAEWILLTGQPTAVATTAPRIYPYTYNNTSNVLSIYF